MFMVYSLWIGIRVEIKGIRYKVGYMSRVFEGGATL
jgi:hypothetical protein